MATNFASFGKSVISDKDPSDGSYEEAEKRGLLHGIYPPRR